MIENLDGYRHGWNDRAASRKQERTEYGVIAQEVQGILPEAVRKNAGGYLGVDYEHLIPVLIEAVKEIRGQLK